MTTLHLTDVPPEVIAWLEAVAAVEGSTVAAVAVRELESASRRADNARLLDALPDTGLSTQALLGHLEDSRHERVAALDTHTGS